jgi:alkylhydroperoxidase family enzyme
LDKLAATVDAPSSLLAATRHAFLAFEPEPPAPDDQRPVPRPPAVGRLPGTTEQALRQLQIRHPALLLRAAVIDQTARDLIAEAAAKARSRDSVTVPVIRPGPDGQHAHRPRTLPVFTVRT